MACSALGAPPRMASVFAQLTDPAAAWATDWALAGAVPSSVPAIASASVAVALMRGRFAMSLHFADQGKALIRHYGYCGFNLQILQHSQVPLDDRQNDQGNWSKRRAGSPCGVRGVQRLGFLVDRELVAPIERVEFPPSLELVEHRLMPRA